MKHRLNILALGSVLVMGFFCSGCEKPDISNLFAACQDPSATDTEIRALAESGLDVNARDANGFTPLFYAVTQRSSDTAKVLIDAGADVNARIEVADMPVLSSALANPDPEMIPLLIRSGADVNATSWGGATALMVAAGGKGLPRDINARVVSELLAAGADVNARSELNWTPLFFAARWTPDPAIVLLLLEAGADAAVEDRDGFDALTYAGRNDALKGTEAFRALRAATRN
ncbi:MAG: ankyrin repeat domain-containing protein [Phycisphaerales bacterium]|nr:ankyrin repeat domain-containing protein [Phycisphaerales bacterium]